MARWSIGALALTTLAVIAGCGGGEPRGGGPFTLVPDWPEVVGSVGSVRGSIAYGSGADPFTEYAKVFRCVMKDQAIVGQLQYSAAVPSPLRFSFAFRDPVSGRTITAPAPAGSISPLDRAEDRASGRSTFQSEVEVPGFHPTEKTEASLQVGDCRATIDVGP